MYFKQLLLTALILGTSLSAIAQTEDRIHEMRVDVVYLASDYLEGRLTGTKGEALAAEYIARRFNALGLEPKGSEGSWYQPFPFKEMTNPHATHAKTPLEGTGKNVVSYIDNQAPQTVIIGGHYDHLGAGGIGSLHAGEPAIHNGADDNASGIAAMIYIAQYLKASKLTHNNYLFIAFSGEELGLFGSKYYTDHSTIDLTKVNYMINMDMVGRLNEEKVLAINGVGTSPLWNQVLPNLNIADIQIRTTESGIGPSDHTPFYLKDIPSLHFFTGNHTEYHKPGDDSHLVNFPGIADVSDFILALIEGLDDKGKIAFTKTKDKAEKKATRFKVTLGIMPDYVYSGSGMRIDGVLSDRPAEKAKLEKGDVIVEMGGIKVNDIYDYMKALGKYEVGDKCDVVVLRGKKQKKVKAEVVF